MEATEVVEFGPSRGRGLIAKRLISSGDVIFREAPLLCCQYSWNRLYGYLSCDHCLRPLESAEANARRLSNNPTLRIPFPEACPVTGSNPLPTTVVHCPDCFLPYCTEQCRSAAAQLYHSAICPKTGSEDEANPVYKLDQVWRNMHYPPESSTIMLVMRMVGAHLSACLHQSPSAQSLVKALDSFVCEPTARVECEGEASSSNMLCHKLLGSEFEANLCLLYEAFVEAVVYLAGRQAMTVAKQSLPQQTIIANCNLSYLLTKDGFLRALCLVGRNGQGIATSSFSLWAKRAEELATSLGDPQQLVQFDKTLVELYKTFEEHVGSFLDVEGVGLYHHQSLLNHSCDPNAVIQFSGVDNEVTLVSLRDIAASEEVTISYLDPCCAERGRHSRRKHLSAYYLFWCDCSLCTQEKLDGAASETSEEDEEDEDEGDDDEDETSGSVENTMDVQ